MTDNPCLRPATIDDLLWSKHKKGEPSRHWPGAFAPPRIEDRWTALCRLYQAEWRKRGFQGG